MSAAIIKDVQQGCKRYFLSLLGKAVLRTENCRFLSGNLEVLPSAKCKKLAINYNGKINSVPLWFIPRSARRTSISSAKKPPWNWVFRGFGWPKNKNFPFGAAYTLKFGLILRNLEASLQRKFKITTAGARWPAAPRTRESVVAFAPPERGRAARPGLPYQNFL